jgi:hypothetical protein
VRTRQDHWELPFVDVELEVEAPVAGYTVLRIERAGSASGRPGRWQSAASVANGHIRMWAGSDGLYCADVATGRTAGPIYFSHAGDSGDEYTANPVDAPPVVFAPDPARAVVAEDAIGPRLRLPIQTVVPARLSPDRQRRVGGVRLTGELLVTLSGRRVDLALRLDNRARDYDLRLMVHLGEGTTAWSGAPFGVEERKTEFDHSSPTARQQWLPDFPFRGWLAAQAADGGGLAVLARGLYEAAVRKPAGGGVDLALTLLRGVGWLSRADLVTRPGHAGPALATPDAQCVGLHHWDLALLPFTPSEFAALPALAEQFLRPAAAFPIQWSAGSAPASRSLFQSDGRLVVTAVRPADTAADAVMVHAHNPTRTARAAAVAGQRCRLDETPLHTDAPLHPFEVAAWLVSR